MSRSGLSGLTIGGLVSLALVQPMLIPLDVGAVPACAPQINRQLEGAALKGAHWGIVIQDLDSGQTLYQKNAHRLFVPASTLKLLTTATALQLLGPDYRWQTPLYLQGQGPNLEQLTLFAQGDPTLTTAHLKAIAESLQTQGIRRINRLTLADPQPQKNPYPDSWEWGDLPYAYAPILSAAILNENQVTLTVTPQELGQPLALSWSDSLALPVGYLDNQTRTVATNPQPLSLEPRWGKNPWLLRGSLSPDAPPVTLRLGVPEPHRYFLAVWQRELRNQGIEVEKTQLLPALEPPPSIPWLTLISAPLKNVMARINQDSHNLYAEALGRLWTPLEGQAFWHSLFPDLSLKVVDSSGLSRQNLLSPQFLVQLLAHMTHTPYADIYKQSLAIAAQGGTLQNRFRDTVVAGKLWGKTGTLGGTAGLAGYMQINEQKTRIVVILVNNSVLESRPLRQALDDIVLLAHQC